MAIGPIGPSGWVPPVGGSGTAGASGDRAVQKSPFVDVVERVLTEANAGQVQADQSVRELALGQTENLHDVMMAVAKADLTFRMVLEVRNRLTEAYQDVMRMQV